MTAPEAQTPPSEKPPTGPGIVSTGWLAADSTFGQGEKRRLGAGLSASLLLHAVLLGGILLVFALTPKETFDRLPDQFVDLVFMQTPGPGGGGGGSPEQAAPAPKPIEVPQPKAPEPVPVIPPEVPPPVPPPPQLNAPILTPNAQMLQASGPALVSFSRRGGGGRGEGIGQGRGSGLGEGEGGGTGGGIYQLGAGIENPLVLREVQPKYTPEAMRAKIQGRVTLQVVITKTGAVGDVKVVKSLDPMGLDQEAIRAAKSWLFKPATRQGQPVDVYAQLELDFRIF